MATVPDTAPDTPPAPPVPQPIRLQILMALPEGWAAFGLQNVIDIPAGMLERLVDERMVTGSSDLLDDLVQGRIANDFAYVANQFALSLWAVLDQRAGTDHPLTHEEYIGHQQLLLAEREHAVVALREAALAEVRAMAAGAPAAATDEGVPDAEETGSSDSTGPSA